MDPLQEPEAAKEESAGAPKSDAEMGEEPPEEAAAAGEEMEENDEIADLSWSSPGSIFSNTQEGDEWPDPDEVRGRQTSQPLFFSRPVPLAQQAHSQPTPQWWHR